MRKSTNLLILIAGILLLMGWAFFRLWNGPVLAESENLSFGAWFWENRGLDIVLQVMLVFAGVLGIAAILPMDQKDD